MDKKELARLLARSAAEFISGPDNDLNLPGGPEPAFGPPLIGFAAGDDTLWREFKTAVHPGHWTPAEAFAEAFGRAPSVVSVMCWVLPQTGATISDQKKETGEPAERWIRNRFFGQTRVCDGLARKLIEQLAALGIESCAPEMLPAWRWLLDGEQGLATPWSQRHAAYAAGLGTFGLCDGLITPAGKAMRLGTLVLESAPEPTPRGYSGYQEYCLYHASGACGKCIKRCPAGAVTEAGHDKTICREYLYGTLRPKLIADWPGFTGGPDEDVPPARFRAPKPTACGLCQVGVPCESGLPGRRRAD